MKTIKFYIATLFLATAFIACDNDDDNIPNPVNEEEIITTLTMTLTPDDGSDVVTLQSRDLDGEGSNDPVLTISGPVKANTTYSGTIVLLNETENPAENITEEVIEESDEHQLFYIPGNGLNLTFDYEDFDTNGNPLGTEYTVTAGDAGTGILNVVLRHEPNKPNDGTLADAGGETDISVIFNITIE